MNTSFFIQSIQLTLSILLQHHISNPFKVLLIYCLKCPNDRMCLPNVENQFRWTQSWYADTTNRSCLYFLLDHEDYFYVAQECVIGHFTVNLTQFFPFYSYSVIAYRLFHKQRPRKVGLVTWWRWMDNSFTLKPTLSLWTPLIICSVGGGSDDKTNPSRQG